MEEAYNRQARSNVSDRVYMVCVLVSYDYNRHTHNLANYGEEEYLHYGNKKDTLAERDCTNLPLIPLTEGPDPHSVVWEVLPLLYQTGCWIVQRTWENLVETELLDSQIRVKPEADLVSFLCSASVRKAD